MEVNFGSKPDDLRTVFQSVRSRLEQLDPRWSYQRKPVATDVPALVPGETVELYLNPWQLSFDPALSIKGKSKMVNVLRCASDFLERPYNSMDNPIHIVIHSPPGSQIPDFSIGHGIGFAKSIAIQGYPISHCCNGAFR